MADVEKMTSLIKQFDESMITDEKYFAKFYERQMDRRNKSARGGDRGGGGGGRRAPFSTFATAMTTTATATPTECEGDEEIAML
jgi:hypothetical protein